MPFAEKKQSILTDTLLEKECTACKIIKPVAEFYAHKISRDGWRPCCKKCHNMQTLRWVREHPEDRKKIYLKWATTNSRKMQEAAKRRWKAHPEKPRAKGRRASAKRLSTPTGKINNTMSRSIWASLKKAKAGRHWESLIGYTLEQLKQHLEKKFESGMTWENYGRYGWHIDHKIPLSAFNFREPGDPDFKKCWALKNLQPMWAFDNLSKGDNLNRPFQPSLTI